MTDQTEREALADRLGDHAVMHRTNLGQYREEQTCECGDKWVLDGHNYGRQYTFYDHIADVVLGYTRQSRAEIQAADDLDKIADDAATSDGRVIVWAVNELTRAVRGVEAAIREEGERG